MKRSPAKANARYIAHILKGHDCSQIVIAPGSRNAPLILAFSSDPYFECFSAPDERVAAFLALGMTMGSRKPVAVICSSGSAAVNFYPAITEAFYRQLPIVVITADRPKEMIDQGIGQAIRQENVFTNHICRQVNLIRNPQDEITINYNQRLINEVMLAVTNGPVHINVPFDEPLYEEIETDPDEKIRIIRKVRFPSQIAADELRELSRSFASYSKVMLLCGQMFPDHALGKSLKKLAGKKPFLLLTESVSNLPIDSAICSIDRLISPLNEDEVSAFSPDLLISFGGDIVSKRIRNLLVKNPPAEHWHLSNRGDVKDTFLSLTKIIEAEPAEFLEALSESTGIQENENYHKEWYDVHLQRKERHEEYIRHIQFSDLKVYHHLQQFLPSGSILHLANSTSVRYVQLFDARPDVEHYANRGTSGIDGCTSTAIGHAVNTEKLLTLISGDVAFLYDSNAFWMDALPVNLRVIIINNQGGNIFRIIEGPEKGDLMERFQETIHTFKGKGIAQTYNIPYQLAENEEALVNLLPEFFEGEGPKILEIITPRKESPDVLKNYFKNLKNV